MGFFEQFPYTNFHELNIDWVLKKAKELAGIAKESADSAKQAIGKADEALKKFDEILANLEPELRKILIELINEGILTVSAGGYIDIRDYGADENSSNNDVAINRAIAESKGVPIFIPAGTFEISNTIKLPANSVIFGSGENSVLKLANGANKDIIQSENYNIDKGTDNHDCEMENIFLCNFAINGNFKDGEAVNNAYGNGISIYGGGIYMQNVVVYNCAENGIRTEYNSYSNIVKNKADESVFYGVVSKLNGKHGWEYLGPHDSMMTNCVIATNSRAETNKYDNLFCGEKANCRVVGCHFYCDYGEIKPRHSVNITSNSWGWNFSTTHIEGAFIPLNVESDFNSFDNCVIYAAFGEYDAVVNAERAIFTSCELKYKSLDEVPTNRPEFKSAFKFLSRAKNCHYDVTLTNTPLVAKGETAMGFEFSDFRIRGYNASKSFDGDYMAIPFSNNIPENTGCSIEILGDFGSQSSYRFRNGYNNFCQAFSTRYNIVGDYTLNGDATVYQEHTLVNEYNSGRLILPPHVPGVVVNIHNFSEKYIPVYSETDINFVNTVYIPPKTDCAFLAMPSSWRCSNTVYNQPDG